MHKVGIVLHFLVQKLFYQNILQIKTFLPFTMHIDGFHSSGRFPIFSDQNSPVRIGPCTFDRLTEVYH